MSDSLLTDAELRVLRLYAQGKQRDQVATALGISATTVKRRLASARRKTGARTPFQYGYLIGVRNLLSPIIL